MANQDEKVIKDIIRKYGEVIDLKETPYLVVEIIRNFGGRIQGLSPDGGLPPGGVPPEPTPGPTSFEGIRNEELMKQILELKKQVTLLSKQVKGLKK